MGRVEERDPSCFIIKLSEILYLTSSDLQAMHLWPMQSSYSPSSHASLPCGHAIMITCHALYSHASLPCGHAIMITCHTLIILANTPRFKVSRAKEVIAAVLKQRLTGAVYHADNTSSWAR